MDKPLALEYEGKQKWYAYEIFKALKYSQTEDAVNKEFEQSQPKDCENHTKNLEEEEKGEEVKQSCPEESISSSSDSEDELDSDYQPEDYVSIRNEIKELRNDFKIGLEKIAIPLNIIANYIMQNQMPKPEIPLLDANESNSLNNSENKQSDVVIHTVEDYQKVRDKYPFEIFLRSELANLSPKSKKEYSRVLQISRNIEPLAYFLFRNLSFTLKTMKSFVSTYQEYYNEYRGFDLEMLKSLYIEKDFKQSEDKETLKKKWNQWRRICYISFGVPKDKFPKITFTSKIKDQKKVSFGITKEYIQDAWKTLSASGKIGDALLIHLMYALGLRTGEIRLLKFDDVNNQEHPTIKVYKAHKGIVKQIEISQALYDEIKNYENELIMKEKYDKTIRKTTESEEVAGHFMYTDSESAIIKKFRRNFGGILSKFNLRPKIIRELSLKEKNNGPKMIKELSLTETSNIRPVKMIKSNSSKGINQGKTSKKLKKKR